MEGERPVDGKPIRVLLIGDNKDDAAIIKRHLDRSKGDLFESSHAKTLDAALKALSKALSEEKNDVVLLDVVLQDTTAMETINKLYHHINKVPIILLTGSDDEALIENAMQVGIQDYLLKSEIDAKLLKRSIRYAMERHNLQEQMRNLILVDELTGLYNRRGFFTLSEQQMNLSRRTQKGFLLFYVDLDNMKHINDTYGHQEGDLALKRVAGVFKRTFRAADIVARIGGDEFVILAIDAFKDCGEIIRSRLEENMKRVNQEKGVRYGLSLSVGEVYFDPASACPMEGLLAVADKRLYEGKKEKQKTDRTV